MKQGLLLMMAGLSVLAVPIAGHADTGAGQAKVNIIAGNRTMDKGVASIDFGNTLLDRLTVPITRGTKLPAGSFQVTDLSGSSAGWSLTMAAEEFTNGSNSFDGMLTINNITIRADATQHNSAMIFHSQVPGYWESPAVDASVTIPGDAVGKYTANVLYTLNNGVAQ